MKIDRPSGLSRPRGTPSVGAEPVEQLHSTALPRLPRAHEFTPGWLAGESRRRVEQLTSYFENSTLEPQYDYIENIKDGRGYTAGRAGFTTRTGDFLMVAEDYARSRPGNALHKHLPRLRELARQDSGSTSGLRGIVGHWHQCCGDEAFKAVQDHVVERLYFTPAMERADQLGLKLPLTRAVLYDTIIQHGDGDDHDGLPAICQRTSRECQGSPAQGVDEVSWLRAFLSDRRAVLMNAADPDTQAVWRESVSRVEAFSQIADNHNFALDGPIRVDLPQENLQFEVP